MSSWPTTVAPRQGVLLLLLLLLPLLQQVDARGFQNIPGDYCRNRKPSECCRDRYDNCSVPIRGTFCYCDQFCLNHDDQPGGDDDCCPDFRDVCVGGRQQLHTTTDLPQRENPEAYDCEVAGVKVPLGQHYLANCNKCTCVGAKLTRCETDECMMDEGVVREVNSHHSRYGWRAATYTAFWGRKASQGFRLRTGTFFPGTLSRKIKPVLLRPNMSAIPLEFDARYNREWRGVVSGVRDQGWCGASWAFSTLAVAQDRLSVLDRDMWQAALAVQGLLSCARLGQATCRAGHIERAWNYLRHSGVVQEQCFPYESGTSGKVPPCTLQEGKGTTGLPCTEPRLYRTQPAYRISSKVEDIQWEILMNGPVQAIMQVHRDFFMYKSGVYSYTGLTGTAMASHSVRILGWGEECIPGSDPIKYWVAANSWGRAWGQDGYFKIKRGENECGIETFILATRARHGN